MLWGSWTLYGEQHLEKGEDFKPANYRELCVHHQKNSIMLLTFSIVDPKRKTINSLQCQEIPCS